MRDRLNTHSGAARPFEPNETLVVDNRIGAWVPTGTHTDSSAKLGDLLRLNRWNHDGKAHSVAPEACAHQNVRSIQATPKSRQQGVYAIIDVINGSQQIATTAVTGQPAPINVKTALR
jgi:predicted lipoprotein with Yx(FWY)xxD motif